MNQDIALRTAITGNGRTHGGGTAAAFQAAAQRPPSGQRYDGRPPGGDHGQRTNNHDCSRSLKSGNEAGGNEAGGTACGQ